MEVLFAIVLIFMMGYAAGALVAWRRHRNQQQSSGPAYRCATCNYCFEISDTTKRLMHPAYTDKLVCIMYRGVTVPVGCSGSTISTVDADSFCDKWKERERDG